MGVFGGIIPWPSYCFAPDEEVFVCTLENRDSTDAINAMKKEKKRAIESLPGGQQGASPARFER